NDAGLGPRPGPYCGGSAQEEVSRGRTVASRTLRSTRSLRVFASSWLHLRTAKLVQRGSRRLLLGVFLRRPDCARERFAVDEDFDFELLAVIRTESTDETVLRERQVA